MKHFAVLGMVVLLITLSLACDTPKALATGEGDEIIVFADDTTWSALESVLKETFEDTVFTPQPEEWFILRRVDFSQFDQFLTHKNRLVVAPLEGEGPVADYLGAALDSTVRRLVEDQGEFVFTKFDVHARLQISMYLTAPTLSALRAAIASRSADLLYYFSNMTLKRELSSIQAEDKYNKHEITDSLLARYNWTMTVQHDYDVAIDSANARFFWMRRATPADMERWIFVHWIDTAQPDILTDEFAIKLRNAITRKFLRTIEDDAYVEIAPYNLEIRQVDFLGRFAYELRGNWRFSNKTGGGPFVSYTFYDPETRRIFLVDGSIFAPRVEKKKLIQQVDGLLHTFRTQQPGESEITAQ
ncbi:MAG: DUF4837 family protein [Ignavibacteriae bacterium]|nr:DUF4837 family protein [Ignavibacteriota bacterium]